MNARPEPETPTLPSVGLFTACTRCSLLTERVKPCGECGGDGFTYELIFPHGSPRLSITGACEACGGEGRVPSPGLCARCEALDEDAHAWADSDRKERA